MSIAARDDVVSIRGESESVRAARLVMERLIEGAERGVVVTRQGLLDTIAEASWRAGRGARVGGEESAGPGSEMGLGLGTGSADGGIGRSAEELMSRDRSGIGSSRGGSSGGIGRGATGRGGVGGVGGGFVSAGGGVGGGGVRPNEPVDEAATLGGDGGRWGGGLDVYAGGRPIVPRSENQRYYLDAIREHDLVFGMGPAGTGKTYLAVAAAVHLLRTGRVRKAILARPAVEAGEKLGFLPGDQYAKLNPYLRPLLDALHDMMDYATINKFMSNDILEIVPLAYMRGRTLNDAIIILDEAQNTTRGQMQMFLTRMGQRSKVIVTGDVTQIDLPDPTESGLIDAARRLRRTQGVAFVHLERADVVRHPLVQRVIDAYAAESAGSDALHRALMEGSGDEEGRDG